MARPRRASRTLAQAEGAPPAEDGYPAAAAAAAAGNASVVLPGYLSSSCSTSAGAPCPITLTLQATYFPSPDVLTDIFPAQLLQARAAGQQLPRQLGACRAVGTACRRHPITAARGVTLFL